MATMVTVTIGRNVGTEPMDSAEWEAFKSEVASALVVRVVGEVIHAATYTSDKPTKYTHHDGTVIREEGAALVLVADGFDRADLDDALGEIAACYGQESVGVAVGESALVGVQG